MVTQVPEVEDFSQDTQVLAGIIDELKAEWNCVTDGPCYVMSNGQHVPLTKFRLSGWASEIVSDCLQNSENALLTNRHRELVEVQSTIHHLRRCSPTGGSHHHYRQSLAVAPDPAPLQMRHPPLPPWIQLLRCSPLWPRWLQHSWPSNSRQSPDPPLLQLLIVGPSGRSTPLSPLVVHQSVPGIPVNVHPPFASCHAHHRQPVHPPHYLGLSMSSRAVCSHLGNPRPLLMISLVLQSRTFPPLDTHRMFSLVVTLITNGLGMSPVSLRVPFLHSASSLVNGALD